MATITSINNKLNPWFVTGFVYPFTKSDQGSFTIRKRKLSSTRNSCTGLVLWGTNLRSTATEGRFTKQVRSMINLPPYQYSIIVEILLSDGWLFLSESRTLKIARLGFRQSINKSAYVWFVFNCLSHYCSRYPYSYASIRNNKPHYNLTITTRALPCFRVI
jgi:hypothetical protein